MAGFFTTACRQIATPEAAALALGLGLIQTESPLRMSTRIMLFHAKRPEPELNPHGHNHNRLNPYRIRLNPADMPATLQLVFAARGLLEQAMNRLMDGQFADTIRDAARLIRRACVLDPDLAIASIILCREGRYSIVHSVGSAIVAERLGRSTGASRRAGGC